MSLRRQIVAIPVFNEERSARQVLERVREVAPQAVVLVVDDGSTDGTASVLAGIPGIAVLRHPRNLGYGRALRDAFDWAQSYGFDQLVTMDCDEQHEPALIPAFFRRLEEGWDIVSGSRYLARVAGSEGEVPLDRLAINREFTARVNALTGFGITDAFCGFKGYQVSALRRLHLSEDGYAMPLEVWVEAWRHGLSIVELPVPLIYKPNFERRFGRGLDDPSARRRYYDDVWRRAVRADGCPAVARRQAGCC
ncbi:MAG: glycosyltransferase family 2 protein [Limnochordaceae bacterium]|uniref:Glycosyltransferase family 2 protein n=1 Tax=Carboxydichorda subterranea TaxID=3109565 RepID=A0ABZ1BYL7_9FIRM|nr:glycosyltransferase family 2 protein [Limnochorda sp. L945t]MBE3598878.1 glycosyltransferase family 2 protein [Limnochordaceae bacterium]WRP17867.1 glycosyltransferase family 2 protein [Limnochorda sp. L945t]